jgi:hypothetical protein
LQNNVNQSLKAMSLGELANRIKEDMGVDPSLSAVEVIRAVCCNGALSPTQVAELSNLTTTRQKLEYIATCMEIK